MSTNPSAIPAVDVNSGQFQRWWLEQLTEDRKRSITYYGGRADGRASSAKANNKAFRDAIEAIPEAKADQVGTAAAGTIGRNGYFIYLPPGEREYVIDEPIRPAIGSARRWVNLVGSPVMCGPNAVTIRSYEPNMDAILATDGLIDTFSMRWLCLYGPGKSALDATGAPGTARALVLGVANDISRICFSATFGECWITQWPGNNYDFQNAADVRIVGGASENSGGAVLEYAGTTYADVGALYVGGDVHLYGSRNGVLLKPAATRTGVGLDGRALQQQYVQNVRFVGAIFSFNGTNPGGSAAMGTPGDDTHAGIYMDSVDLLRPNIRSVLISGCQFKANVNDIVIRGHNGSMANFTGVNMVEIAGCQSDAGFRRFALIDGANHVRVSNTQIGRCNQEGIATTISAIEVTGTSDRSSFDDVSVSLQPSGATHQPDYGLDLGPQTTNNREGVNDFQGRTGTVRRQAGATGLLPPAQVAY